MLANLTLRGSFIVALVVCAAAWVNGESFDTPKVSWSGTKVRVEVKTDLADGSSAMIAITGRTSSDKGMRGEFLGRVKSGQLIGSGSVHLIEDTIDDHINAEPGHYLVVIMMDGGGLYTFEFGPK